MRMKLGGQQGEIRESGGPKKWELEVEEESKVERGNLGYEEVEIRGRPQREEGQRREGLKVRDWG